jgi:hypothetical protein
MRSAEVPRVRSAPGRHRAVAALSSTYRQYRNENWAKEIMLRFEVLTAVTMKNVVFWDIKTQFVLHRRHITSPLQIPAG